jgi:hypothetical protein
MVVTGGMGGSYIGWFGQSPAGWRRQRSGGSWWTKPDTRSAMNKPRHRLD